MYIDKLICENVGPIKGITLAFRKNAEGDPVPCIFVGENGSGKSTLQSFIVDSFFELAEPGYRNATKKIVSGHEYFKIISGNSIRIGANHCVAYMEYINNDETILYYYKSGTRKYEDFVSTHFIKDLKGIKWNENDNDKGVSISVKTSKELFKNNVLCYFPPSRYEKPNWLGKDYYDVQFNSDDSYDGDLKNPIIVNNVTNNLLQWLFDIIADSRVDLKYTTEDKAGIIYPVITDTVLMSVARKNVEEIMGTILGRNVVFKMGFRNSGRNRFSICDAHNGSVLIPSLDSLSTGQMALFLLFASIARYADRYDLNKSINLNQIKGIVVIDEADLHLHSKLQREVLPKLFKLFPKVQFILSTHSPLVLMGLNEVYEGNVDIIEMPSGNPISVERFTEFENAYKYYTETEKYRNDFQKAIEKINNDIPLVITEGATDWRHIKAALSYYKSNETLDWIQKMNFELLEYDPENSCTDNPVKIQMSNKELESMVEGYSKLPQRRKMIFIADNDVQDVGKKLMEPNKEYKEWGNNVFSLTIPVPSFRKCTPNISIEHLYKDSDIKKWVIDKDSKRRVFLGNEFNNDGFYTGSDGQYFCRDKNSCGENKIKIIDGNGNKKVIEPYGDDPNKNLALTKMDFANMVLDKKVPFDQMDFSGFLPLFETINQILNN